MTVQTSLAMKYTAIQECFLFFLLAAPYGMQDLSSLTRDRTEAP